MNIKQITLLSLLFISPSLFAMEGEETVTMDVENITFDVPPETVAMFKHVKHYIAPYGVDIELAKAETLPFAVCIHVSETSEFVPEIKEVRPLTQNPQFYRAIILLRLDFFEQPKKKQHEDLHKAARKIKNMVKKLDEKHPYTGWPFKDKSISEVLSSIEKMLKN